MFWQGSRNCTERRARAHTAAQRVCSLNCLSQAEEGGSTYTRRLDFFLYFNPQSQKKTPFLATHQVQETRESMQKTGSSPANSVNHSSPLLAPHIQRTLTIIIPIGSSLSPSHHLSVWSILKGEGQLQSRGSFQWEICLSKNWRKSE